MIRRAALSLVLLAALPAAPAQARTVALVLPTLACDNSIVQRELYEFELLYGSERLLEEQRLRIDMRNCVWLEAGSEAQVSADDGDDQLCLEIEDFAECMWVMKDSLE